MRPLIIYQAPWDWSFLWNRAQPLATALSAHASVLYLNCGVENTDLLARIIRRIPKIRSWARNRFHWGTLERIGEKLFVHHWQSLKENQWFLVSRDRPERSYRMLSRVIRRLAVGHDEVWLLTSRPAARGLLDLWPWDRVIVDIEDPWLELNWADSIPREWVYDLLRTAEVVFANGPMIARDYSAFSAREVVNLPNGIDQSFLHRLVGFSAPPDFFNSPSRPRLVYTGHINNRINTVMLAEVIDRCPTVDFYFVGKANVTEIGSELWNKLNERKNFHSISTVPHASIPSILAHSHALLLPYTNWGSHAMFPAKLFEYIAAGKPIISTLDFELGSMMPPTLRVCRTTDEMVEAIQKIVAGHWVVSSAERNDCWRLAESNTWNERAKTFLDIVNTASHRFKC